MRHERGPRELAGPRSLAIAAVALFLTVAPLARGASAHAERVGSQPEANARVREAPATLSIDFSEPPTGDAILEVLDGCGDDVVDELTVQNMQITADLAEGQPGNWKVGSTVVSVVDGHQTRDEWSFSVAGQKDCSADGSGGGPDQAGDADEEEGSSFPVLPAALGTLAVLALAVLLRVLTEKSEGPP